MQPVEVWKPVVDWEGYYEVSSLGRVRSVTRTVRRSNGTTQTLRGRMRKLQPTHDGRVAVMMCRDSRVLLRTVHRLVARAFLGEPVESQVVCHNDGNPTNNRVENLRWDTASANQMDRVAHGTHNRGERHNMVKLSEAQVLQIRRLYANGGVSQERLGNEFGVSQSAISLIVRGEKWSWLAPVPAKEVVA